jgi:hypothetical protein
MAEHYEVQWRFPGRARFAAHWQTLRRRDGSGLAVSEELEEARRMYEVAKASFAAEDSLRLIKVTTEVMESVGPES